MGNMVRTISADGSIMACAVDATDIVAKLEQIHKPSAAVTAALGRLTIAAAMMGAQLKGDKHSITLRMNGGGPAGTLIAVSDSQGQVKSYVQQPIAELPLNQYGKLDVAGVVGTDGLLSVVKDLGMREPYVGQIPIESGEIAEDITRYYAVSEQIPTVCGLGVLVNPDLTVRAAGGYLVQLLPFADESCIDRLEENLKKLEPVSAMIDKGMTPEEICFQVLAGMDPNTLDESRAAYRCDCSKTRVEKALLSLGKSDLEELVHEGEDVEVNCQFCEKKYRFSPIEVKTLLAQSTSDPDVEEA